MAYLDSVRDWNLVLTAGAIVTTVIIVLLIITWLLIKVIGLFNLFLAAVFLLAFLAVSVVVGKYVVDKGWITW